MSNLSSRFSLFTSSSTANGSTSKLEAQSEDSCSSWMLRCVASKNRQFYTTQLKLVQDYFFPTDYIHFSSVIDGGSRCTHSYVYYDTLCKFTSISYISKTLLSFFFKEKPDLQRCLKLHFKSCKVTQTPTHPSEPLFQNYSLSV